MKLHKIRGGNIADLENRNYTISVGLSLGNKWFTSENIIEQIKWALNYSKDKVVIYIADSIHAINISVRSRKSMESAKKFALKESEELFDKIKEGLKDFSEADKARLVFVTWDEIVDKNFKAKLDYLRSKYAEKGAFQEKIYQLVRNHTSKEGRNFSDDDIHTLGSYIIEELPECINRVPMKGIVVDAYMYPQDNEIVEMVEEIQNGTVFPEIKEVVMDTEPKVVLIVN